MYSQGGTIQSRYDPSIIVAANDIIFVNINYRLNMLGFLYLNSSDAPGNQGLLDQQLAIKWVFDNIEYFGGDNNRITLFGDSAGGASSSFHLFSPLTEPYFHNVIMQSGTAIANVALADRNELYKLNVRILNKLDEEIKDIFA